MENLIFSLNATLPVFLLMLIGFVFRHIGWMEEDFAYKINKLVFRIGLPMKVFLDLATVDFAQSWNGRFVLFCFGVTLISIAITAVISFCWKDKSMQGEFIQASYRSSAALLGLVLIQNIYGNSGMAPMMIIGSVPLYNIFAVLILSFFGKKKKGLDKATIKKSLIGIITNPIIIAIALGLVWSALRIPMPSLVNKTASHIANIATPMGLMAMGATFDWNKAFAKIKPALVSTFIKIIGLAAIFVPIAVALGFRNSELVAILVMLGSATTFSCYVMAKNMGHEGTLTSSVVMLSTMLCAFTLTGWLYLLKTLALI